MLLVELLTSKLWMRIRVRETKEIKLVLGHCPCGLNLFCNSYFQIIHYIICVFNLLERFCDLQTLFVKIKCKFVINIAFYSLYHYWFKALMSTLVSRLFAVLVYLGGY